MRAVIYARLSRKTDTNAPNIVDQLKRCRELADTRGWTVVAERVDYGESAYDRDEMDDRPAYADVLDDISKKRCDVIVAWRPDRLWRDPIDAAIMLRRCSKHGVNLVATVTEGDRDPNNPGDEMVATIIAAVGRYESAAKSVRLRAKHRQLAELGRYHGGQVAYGFVDPQRTRLDRTEVRIIREVVRRAISGEALTAIVDDLNRRGIPRKYSANGWTVSVLQQMLKSPYIAGKRVHHGKVVGDAQWTAIIPEDVWLELQAAIVRPGRQHRAEPFLLSTGIATCGLCGVGLVGQRRGARIRTYWCAKGSGWKGCGRIRSDAVALEDHVVGRLWDDMDAGRLRDPITETPAVRLDEVNAADARLTELARDYYIDKRIDKATFVAMQEPLRQEADRLRAALGAVSVPVTLATVREHWDDLGVVERREVLRDVVAHLNINPAVRGRNRFDVGRVALRWRDEYLA